MANNNSSKILISKSFLNSFNKRQLYFWACLIADNTAIIDYSKTTKLAIVNFIYTFAKLHCPTSITINELNSMPYDFIYNLSNFFNPNHSFVRSHGNKQIIVEFIYNFCHSGSLELR